MKKIVGIFKKVDQRERTYQDVTITHMPIL